MARPLRVEYSGAVYHVMSRGNGGQDIFLSSADRLLFLDTLSEVCKQTGWRIHAYVLMNNHYHLLLETPEPNLVAGMKWFQGTYTQRFNLRHQRCGHLYQGRYKSIPVDSDDPSYFRMVGTYIHLNPVRAGIVQNELGLAQDSLWSSYPHYVDGSLQPDWLDVFRLLSCCQIPEPSSTGRQAYRFYVASRIVEFQSGCVDSETEQLRNAGWCHGGEQFRKELSGLLEVSTSWSKDVLHGDQRVDHGAGRAENLLETALNKLEISEEELLSRKAVDEDKQAIAWLLNQHTCMTAIWVANRLNMGHRSNVSRALRTFKHAKEGRSGRIKCKMIQCTG